MTDRVILVGCVAQKLNHPAPARELYTSPLFRKRREYAEAANCPWAVFSAKYGLVWPERVIEPYDLRIDDVPRWKRESLGRNVGREIRHELGWSAPRFPLDVPAERRGVELRGLTIEVHAGAAYVAALRWPIEVAGHLWRWQLETPVAGLGIGRQLAWYGARATA